MVELVEHKTGRALEPSAGEGHLARALKDRNNALDLSAIELDASLGWEHDDIEHQCQDFFAYTPQGGGFDVIFGNPPYVAFKNVSPETRRAVAATGLEYPEKTNLYHLFIHRCVDLLNDKGELVFIVPAEWFFTTSAAQLRSHISKTGALTDVVHCGEEKLFRDADVPAIMIFRFVKGVRQGAVRYWGTFDAAKQRLAPESRSLVTKGARWALMPKDVHDRIASWGKLSDVFDVHVGLVSGLDAAFALGEGHDIEPEATTRMLSPSGTVSDYIFLEDVSDADAIPEKAASHLALRKTELLARRIRSFDESNWWKYGAVRNRAVMEGNRERIFVPAKTRAKAPFFRNQTARHFSGAVLGLFKKDTSDVATEDALRLLNSDLLREIFDCYMLTTGDKLSLQPATLLDIPFPASQRELQTALNGLVERNSDTTATQQGSHV